MSNQETFNQESLNPAERFSDPAYLAVFIREAIGLAKARFIKLGYDELELEYDSMAGSFSVYLGDGRQLFSTPYYDGSPGVESYLADDNGAPLWIFETARLEFGVDPAALASRYVELLADALNVILTAQSKGVL